MDNRCVLALFDFDGTMIKGDSIVAYLRLARRMNALSRREYWKVAWQTLRYYAGRVSGEEAKSRALRFRQRLDQARRDALDAAFAREELVPRVYADARACLEEHCRQGHKTLLVSASTENYMRFVAEALRVDALLATPVDERGAVGPNCKGEEKIRRVKDWLSRQGLTADYAASYAYGDSKSDLPMLRLCGHPCLVNPKKALKKAAGGMPEARWK